MEGEAGRGSGWGTHVNPWLIHVNVWQKPLQYCKAISLQLIKINGKKIKFKIKKKKENGRLYMQHDWVFLRIRVKKTQAN